MHYHLTMKYNLFLFDLDDTLLDFKESEKLCFFSSLKALGVDSSLDEMFSLYQVENAALWRLFEQGQTTKEHLKVERFRKVFDAFNVTLNPEEASQLYLNSLPDSVVLMDYARELLEFLKDKGEIGIITNGIAHVQTKRIDNSNIKEFLSFVSVSEDCGYAKPDTRFFEYTVSMAKNFDKTKTIVIGDRYDADIVGGHRFGIDTCWFNPKKVVPTSDISATYTISHLKDFEQIIVP